MEPTNLPRTLTWPLTLVRGEARLTATLVLAFEERTRSWDELGAAFLGPTEFAYFSKLPVERRRKSYLLGRYAAKVALREHFPEFDPKAVEILKGIFEQPIIHSERNGGWEVTISHAGTLAASIAFPAGHPMGIDVERIDRGQEQTILSQLAPHEIAWVKNAAADSSRMATALWTAKEALSKVLTTGLMTPFTVYKLSEFSRIDAGIWEGQFENFGQYRVQVWAGSTYVLSIVLPKRSAFAQPPNFCAFL